MEDEIKVGELVRLKNGKIIKFNGYGELHVHNIVRNPDAYENEHGSLLVKTIISGRKHFRYDTIVKHSKNIIDLIEVGDVIEFIEQTEGKEGTELYGKYIQGIHDENELKEIYKEIEENGIKIVGILTKEQYEANVYKLEE